MTKKQLQNIADTFNGNKVKLVYTDAEPDYFCYDQKDNVINISKKYYMLSESEQIIYLLHEIGHMNTLSSIESIFVSDYAAEYAANKWVLEKLKEKEEFAMLTQFKIYLRKLASIKTKDSIEQEYKLAAKDILKQWSK